MAQRASFPTLLSKIRVTGVIETLTGLHVGGSEVGLKIGGADKVVVKDPKTGRPYIPGSTLKGKMRSLLEKSGHCCSGGTLNVANHRRSQNDIGPCHCGACIVCDLFGVPAEEGRRSAAGPSPEGAEAAPDPGASVIRCVGRLIFRDAPLTDLSATDMENWRYLAAPFVEVKTEVSIDRLTSQANPRNFERVPAGACFHFEVVLDVCEGDNADRSLQTLFDGLRLVASDYLGGQGTRGYGAVRFRIETVQEMSLRRGSAGAFVDRSPPNGIPLPWVEP